MNTLLEQIINNKRKQIILAKEKQSESTLLSQINQQTYYHRGFAQALARKIEIEQPAIIAEIKPASPSKGIIKADCHAATIAQSYATAGAACLSVLTETDYFQGSIKNLIQARNACDLPTLRKDFIFDRYQIFETRAMQADCLLLIVAILKPEILLELYDLAQQLDLEILIEVHSLAELDIALSCPKALIGINNRDLNTFKTNILHTIELLPHVPDDRIIISESGFHCREDIDKLRQNGVNCFLIGESLMKHSDPGAALRTLLK